MFIMVYDGDWERFRLIQDGRQDIWKGQWKINQFRKNNRKQVQIGKNHVVFNNSTINEKKLII